MDILKEIKAKSNIDIDSLMKRLKKELSITDENKDILEYAFYDTLIIILDMTHQKKVEKELYTIWVNMIKDYWYLNKYDKLGQKSEEITEESENVGGIKSITQGNEKVEFYSEGAFIDINGTRYETDKIDFSTNLLREKYKTDLYKHRKMRW